MPREPIPLPSFNDLVVRAAALALREFPALNVGHEDGKTLRYGRINIGIAVAGDDALIVPTIFDADRLTLIEIAAEARRLAERARTRSLAAGELADGTFTVSNLGMFGVRRFHAVINPPQAAILAVGEVAQPAGRRRRRPAGRARGRWRSRSLATTASSTAPRRLGSSQACAGCSSDPTRLVTAGGT